MNYLPLLRDKMVSCKKWINLKERLDQDIATAGKCFEVFAKYYFLTEPKVKDDYKNIWLIDEIPLDIGLKLNISSNREHGIDLVLELTDGTFEAVQCKYRVNEDSKLSWTKDKLANLFAYIPKAQHFSIFTNASDIDNVSKTRNDSFTLYSISDLLEISPEVFDAIKESLTGKKRIITKATPREYQINATNNVIEHFKNNNRGQLILPCGAGKTFIALWIKESLLAKKTLVLVPSLALLKQIKNEWAEHKNESYNYLCVCSEKDIDSAYDSLITHTYDLGKNVTTDPDTITKFLLSQKPLVVFSTYQSLPKIEEALRDKNITFDLAICDEAHKTAGSKYGNVFGLIHNNSKIPVSKRLYMTATPKVLAVNTRSTLDEQGYISDMSNSEIFGTEAYRMSFKEAIDKGILVDYQIVAIGVSDQDLQEYLQKRKYISINESMDELANQYAIEKVMDSYKASHAITFHSRVELARKFSMRHSELYPQTQANYVSGSQTTSIRDKILRAFKTSDKAIVSNARCLTEGVNIPIIDLVYFCDPKHSKIDIVQASGRALRKDTSGKKQKGYIVVPIFHTNSESVECVIEGSIFKNLVQVVRALCDQDERLQVEINKASYERGKRISHVSFNYNEEKIIQLIGFEDKLREALFSQIIEKNKTTWEVQLNYLMDFRKQNPTRWPKAIEIFPQGNPLGSWCDTQRQKFKREELPIDRVDKFNLINFPWDPFSDQWPARYDLLIEYLENKRKLPKKDEVFKGIRLGNWCDVQRREYIEKKLTPKRKKLLDEVGFIFSPQEHKWNLQFNILKTFKKQNPNRWPTAQEEYPKGNRLGGWCFKQREMKKEGKLKKERILLLKSINFLWKYEDPWEKRFKEVLDYRKKNPNSWPILSRKASKWNSLGYWCKSQREKFETGKMDNYQIGLLNSIGFTWDKRNYEKEWLGKYNALVKFIKKNNKWPTESSKDEVEKYLSGWCGKQRFNYQSLSNKERALLNRINFKQKPLDDNWNIYFQHLKEFRKKYPNRWPNYSEKYPDSVTLGMWCCWQRRRFVNGKLPKIKINFMNSIHFPWNQDYNRQINWEKQYIELVKYRTIHPTRWPVYKEEYPKGNKLGHWCYSQRLNYKNNNITPDQRNKLSDINFLWKVKS